MAWILVALQGVANVMEVVTFIQFIEEEAIQSASLGVFLAVRGKAYDAAWIGINLLELVLIPHLEEINTYAGWMAPYSKGCFADFILASKANLEVYKSILFLH